MNAKKLSELEKAEAREHFENQLRYAFAKYDEVEEDDEDSEVTEHSSSVLLIWN